MIVLTPGSQLDAEQAGLTHIEKDLVAADIPVLETELNERETFRTIFSFRKALLRPNLSEVASLDKAVANAGQFSQEVIAALRKVQQHVSEASVSTSALTHNSIAIECSYVDNAHSPKMQELDMHISASLPGQKTMRWTN